MSSLSHQDRVVLREIQKHSQWQCHGGTDSAHGGPAWFSSPSGACFVPSTMDALIRKGLITLRQDDRQARIELTERAKTEAAE